MNPPPVQAVVFDLDDTLYAERDYVRSGYRAVARAAAASDEQAERIAAWMWRRFQSGRTDGMVSAAAARFGFDDSDASIASLVRAYREHAPRIAPLDEAVEVLRALRGRVKLGLLSDGFLPAQRLKLDALGVGGYFDAVVFTESMGRDCWKPSPAGFERIAAELGAPHASCVYVGDNLAKDFVAPNALGWLSILWRRDGQVHAARVAPEGGRPSVAVESGAELLAALAARTALPPR